MMCVDGTELGGVAKNRDELVCCTKGTAWRFGLEIITEIRWNSFKIQNKNRYVQITCCKVGAHHREMTQRSEADLRAAVCLQPGAVERRLSSAIPGVISLGDLWMYILRIMIQWLSAVFKERHLDFSLWVRPCLCISSSEILHGLWRSCRNDVVWWYLCRAPKERTSACSDLLTALQRYSQRSQRFGPARQLKNVCASMWQPLGEPDSWKA